MKFIKTLDEANAAPFGTAVLNGYGEIYQKNQDGLWYGATEYGQPTITEALFYGVIERPVIWSPGDHQIYYQDA